MSGWFLYPPHALAAAAFVALLWWAYLPRSAIGRIYRPDDHFRRGEPPAP